MGSVNWLHITVLYLENTNIFTENSKSDGLTNSEFWFVKKKKKRSSLEIYYAKLEKYGYRKEDYAQANSLWLCLQRCTKIKGPKEKSERKRTGTLNLCIFP